MDKWSLWEKTLPPESTHDLIDKAERFTGWFFGAALVLVPLTAIVPAVGIAAIGAVLVGLAHLS